jgi:hypothetical protein
VQNIYCQIITATEGETGTGYLAGTSDTVYTYENDGKIFLYDPNNENFSLVYDFSAGPGTSWTTSWDTCAYERTISEVDSIEVNGNFLKVLSHGGFSILERIGGMETLFHGMGMVDCTGPDTIVYELPFVQQLRCYEDDVLGYYETGVAPQCDHMVSAVGETVAPGIEIYPNPASQELNIKFSDQYVKLRTITLFSSLGIRVFSVDTDEDAIRIDVSGFEEGLYILEVQDGDGKKIVQKIIVL